MILLTRRLAIHSPKYQLPIRRDLPYIHQSTSYHTFTEVPVTIHSPKCILTWSPPLTFSKTGGREQNLGYTRGRYSKIKVARHKGDKKMSKSAKKRIRRYGGKHPGSMLVGKHRGQTQTIVPKQFINKPKLLSHKEIHIKFLTKGDGFCTT